MDHDNDKRYNLLSKEGRRKLLKDIAEGRKNGEDLGKVIVEDDTGHTRSVSLKEFIDEFGIEKAIELLDDVKMVPMKKSDMADIENMIKEGKQPSRKITELIDNIKDADAVDRAARAMLLNSLILSYLKKEAGELYGKDCPDIGLLMSTFIPLLELYLIPTLPSTKKFADNEELINFIGKSLGDAISIKDGINEDLAAVACLTKAFNILKDKYQDMHTPINIKAVMELLGLSEASTKSTDLVWDNSFHDFIEERRSYSMDAEQVFEILNRQDDGAEKENDAVSGLKERMKRERKNHGRF